LNRFKLIGLVTLGVVLAGVGLATWATPASANAGPHGGYTLTTSACAGCHRAHTAESANLVKADSIYGLCTSCHGGLVSTDVVHESREPPTPTASPEEAQRWWLRRARQRHVPTMLRTPSRHTVAGIDTAWHRTAERRWLTRRASRVS
jgi:predicted CXXCH cytochrome family protein